MCIRDRGHATLIRTVPPNGAVLVHSPATVRIVFDDVVQRGPGIEVVRNGGASVLDGKPRAGGGRTLVLPLRRGLAKGDYTVRWAIVSDDGHLESGVLAFAVGLGSARPVPSLGAEATGARPPDVIARWLFLAGVLGAVGIAAFALSSGVRDEQIALCSRRRRSCRHSAPRTRRTAWVSRRAPEPRSWSALRTPSLLRLRQPQRRSSRVHCQPRSCLRYRSPRCRRRAATRSIAD